jgi:hypothetical protein
MKTKHAIILIILGLCVDILGALFKILHLTGADQMLMLAAMFQVCGGLLFLIKLMTNPKLKEFLDWLVGRGFARHQIDSSSIVIIYDTILPVSLRKG